MAKNPALEDTMRALTSAIAEIIREEVRQAFDARRAEAPTERGDPVLTADEVLTLIPLDRSTLWRMYRSGRFPPPLQLTANRIGWRLSVINRWLDERERRPVTPREYFGRKRRHK